MTSQPLKTTDQDNANTTLAEPRGRIYSSIIETIGATPLVRMPQLTREEGLKADLLAKLEFFNPLASVKDRIAYSMIENAEKAGKIEPGKTTLIEPTSGNTGIGLAFVAASKGYKLILTMPESMSLERRKMLAFLGADIVLTPKEKGMNGALEKAEELLANTPDSFAPGQFVNPANPEIHEKTTAQEILKDTEGDVDMLICGVGTGGTLTGVSRVLKEHNPEFKVVAVEPEDSPVLSGGEPGLHKIQGIGAGFIPEILDVSFIDEIIKVSNDTAIETAKRIALLEGIPGGLSSGAAWAAAIEVAKREENAGKKIVVIIPSFAERYLSSVLFEDIDV
jgi:cysteine synthase A